MDQRLENLETKLAHIELLLDELNRTIYRQGKQLESAQSHIESLKGRIKELTEPGAGSQWSAADEQPPHY